MLFLPSKPREYSPQTHAALRATDGYLYLGLMQEALDELDGIETSDQGDTTVLLSRVRALLHMRRWECAESLASRCIEDLPEVGEFTVQRAFALHQMKKGDEAMDVILYAPEWIAAPASSITISHAAKPSSATSPPRAAASTWPSR